MNNLEKMRLIYSHLSSAKDLINSLKGKNFYKDEDVWHIEEIAKRYDKYNQSYEESWYRIIRRFHKMKNAEKRRVIEIVTETEMFRGSHFEEFVQKFAKGNMVRIVNAFIKERKRYGNEISDNDLFIWNNEKSEVKFGVRFYDFMQDHEEFARKAIAKNEAMYLLGYTDEQITQIREKLKKEAVQP